MSWGFAEEKRKVLGECAVVNDVKEDDGEVETENAGFACAFFSWSTTRCAACCFPCPDTYTRVVDRRPQQQGM
jgi:hypothetical protein